MEKGGGIHTQQRSYLQFTDAERGEFSFFHWSDTGYANHDSGQVACSEIIG